jgi:8-oxo-dGTP diphosphatase
MNNNKAILSRPRILLVTRAIVLYRTKILLMQRSAADTSDPSKWEIPGGKLDKGQSFNQAIEREIIEEAGIYAKPLSALAFYDSAIDGSSKYKGIPYVRLTGLYKTDNDTVRLSTEHSAFAWVSFTEALTMDLTEYSRKSLLAWEDELKKYSLYPYFNPRA